MNITFNFAAYSPRCVLKKIKRWQWVSSDYRLVASVLMYFSEEPRKFKDVSFVSDLIEQQQIWVSRALSSFLKQDILTFSEEAKEMKANLSIGTEVSFFPFKFQLHKLHMLHIILKTDSPLLLYRGWVTQVYLWLGICKQGAFYILETR